MKKILLAFVLSLLILPTFSSKAINAYVWHYHSGQPGIWVIMGNNGFGGIDCWCRAGGNTCERWDWMTLWSVAPPTNYGSDAMAAAAAAENINLPPLQGPDIEYIENY